MLQAIGIGDCELIKLYEKYRNDHKKDVFIEKVIFHAGETASQIGRYYSKKEGDRPSGNSGRAGSHFIQALYEGETKMVTSMVDQREREMVNTIEVH